MALQGWWAHFCDQGHPELVFEEPLREWLPSEGVDDGSPLLEVFHVVDERGVTQSFTSDAGFFLLAGQIGPTSVLPMVPFQTSRAPKVTKVLALGSCVTGIMASAERQVS